MCRLLGPCRGAPREDVLVAADVDAPSEEETDFEARAAFRKAKQEGGRKRTDYGGERQKIAASNVTANAIRRRGAHRGAIVGTSHYNLPGL